MKPFPKIKSATTVIGFKFWFETKSDGNLDVNKIMCRILLLFTSIITISLSIDDKTSFLAQISLSLSHYRLLLKIATKRLFGCRVISLSLCILCRKELLCVVSHTGGIIYRYARHSMIDGSWSEMTDCCSKTSSAVCLWWRVECVSSSSSKWQGSKMNSGTRRSVSIDKVSLKRYSSHGFE